LKGSLIAQRYGQSREPDATAALDAGEVRRRLEKRRDQIRGRVAALARPPELGESQGFGKRIGDGTIEAISRLTEIGVGSSLESSLARTERALAKLDEGSYGLCDTCGDPIPVARLRAMPDSVSCLSCAAARPSARPARRR
jgi:DnaK suppressor protein